MLTNILLNIESRKKSGKLLIEDIKAWFDENDNVPLEKAEEVEKFKDLLRKGKKIKLVMDTNEKLDEYGMRGIKEQSKISETGGELKIDDGIFRKHFSVFLDGAEMTLGETTIYTKNSDVGEKPIQGETYEPITSSDDFFTDEFKDEFKKDFKKFDPLDEDNEWNKFKVKGHVDYKVEDAGYKDGLSVSALLDSPAPLDIVMVLAVIPGKRKKSPTFFISIPLSTLMNTTNNKENIARFTALFIGRVVFKEVSNKQTAYHVAVLAQEMEAEVRKKVE